MKLINNIKDGLKGNMKGKYISLLLRFVLLVAVSILYFTKSNLLEYPRHFLDHILPLHVLWLFFMAFFIARLFGKKNGLMANNRKYLKYNEIEPEYDKDKLRNYANARNIRALWIILVALIIIIPFWVLYFNGIIDERFLFLIFVLYFFLDIVCETIYCPLQRIFMKNRCCHVCRIYSWNSILNVVPLFIIPGFFSASLILIALIDLVVFEIKYKRHPEYFWDGSNAALRCVNCSKKMCVVRGKMY